MRPSRERSRQQDRHSDKIVVGTRFNELYFTPLPLNATVDKVKALLNVTEVKCTDVRIHRGKRSE